MNTCWRCKNPLRAEGLAFCPACGAAVSRGDDPVARDWALRLQEGSQHQHWALSFLWLLCGPLLVLVFPFLLARANARLKRHQAERLAAPAFASPRFNESPEGKAILARFRAAVATGTAGTNIQAAVLFILIAATAGIPFIVPLLAPSVYDYHEAIGSVINGDPACRVMWVSDDSPEAYEAQWKQLDEKTYSKIQVGSFRDSNSMRALLPHWNGTSDTREDHRPMRYIGPDGEVHRVTAITISSEYAAKAHVAFIIGLIVSYLCQMWFGLSFWLRFARHSQTEVLAAAYARGDLKYHDEMVGKVRMLNGLLIVLAIILAITPGQIFCFPFLSAIVFAHHLKWERSTGITAALGFAST